MTIIRSRQWLDVLRKPLWSVYFLKDSEGIFILIRKLRSSAPYFPTYRDSLIKLFPVGFEREDAINIAMCFSHISQKIRVWKFPSLLGFWHAIKNFEFWWKMHSFTKIVITFERSKRKNYPTLFFVWLSHKVLSKFQWKTFKTNSKFVLHSLKFSFRDTKENTPWVVLAV